MNKKRRSSVDVRKMHNLKCYQVIPIRLMTTKKNGCPRIPSVGEIVGGQECVNTTHTGTVRLESDVAPPDKGENAHTPESKKLVTKYIPGF